MAEPGQHRDHLIVAPEILALDVCTSIAGDHFFARWQRRRANGVACWTGVGRMQRFLFFMFIFTAGACSGPTLPPPNGAQVIYDGRNQAVQVTISSVAPPTAAALVSASGARYQAPGLSLLSGPHVAYNPPPTLGFGIGGIGFSGCCGFGSGVGLGVPVGRPTVADVSDQYIVSALIPTPADYRTNWASYHIEISSGSRPLILAAPPPG
jgi:hypothetical protein